MFIRSKMVKGRAYYQLVETYRDKDGRVRHRTLASLGRCPTIQEARAAAMARYLARRQGKDWHAAFKLDRLLRECPDYEPDPAMEKEWNRRHRARAAAGREARTEGRRRKREKFREFMAELDDTAERLREDQATLGVAPSADEIRAAYRRKARECHPDHGGSEEMMTRVNAAYRRLVDRAGRGSADPPSASAAPPLPRSRPCRGARVCPDNRAPRQRRAAQAASELT